MSGTLSSNPALLGVYSRSAMAVLVRATEHDTNKRYEAALACYQEGIQLVMDAMKNCDDKTVKARLRQKAEEFMNRAEEVKAIVQRKKESGTYHEEIRITDGSSGYSYEKIFSRFLDCSVTVVEVYDAYICAGHQIANFLRFCELLVRLCPNLKQVILTTTNDKSDASVQRNKLQQIAQSLTSRGVELAVNYSPTLHDREIRINNGYVVKIGRGLDYFKNVQNYSIGYFDYELRPCHETTIDIYYKK